MIKHYFDDNDNKGHFLVVKAPPAVYKSFPNRLPSPWRVCGALSGEWFMFSSVCGACYKPVIPKVWSADHQWSVTVNSRTNKKDVCMYVFM